jgi:hypothetical protein
MYNIQKLIKCLKNRRTLDDKQVNDLRKTLPYRLRRKLDRFLVNDHTLNIDKFIDNLRNIGLKSGGTQDIKKSIVSPGTQSYSELPLGVNFGRFFKSSTNDYNSMNSKHSISQSLKHVDYKTLPVLGEGSFGTVRDADPFAIKVLDKNASPEDEAATRETLTYLHDLKDSSCLDDCNLHGTTFISLLSDEDHITTKPFFSYKMLKCKHTVNFLYSQAYTDTLNDFNKLVKLPCIIITKTDLKNTYEKLDKTYQNTIIEMFKLANAKIINYNAILLEYASKFPFKPHPTKETYFVHGDIKNENLMLDPNAQLEQFDSSHILLTDLDGGLLYDAKFNLISSRIKVTFTPLFVSPLYYWYLKKLELVTKTSSSRLVAQDTIKTLLGFETYDWQQLPNTINLSNYKGNNLDKEPFVVQAFLNWAALFIQIGLGNHIPHCYTIMKNVVKDTFNEKQLTVENIIKTADEISIKAQVQHNINNFMFEDYTMTNFSEQKAGGKKHAQYDGGIIKCPKVSIDFEKKHITVYESK